MRESFQVVSKWHFAYKNSCTFQDLPNYAQHMVPIFSLPQEWLWCESWCGNATKPNAKTIDLCNNPMTKEPKLQVSPNSTNSFLHLVRVAWSLLLSSVLCFLVGSPKNSCRMARSWSRSSILHGQDLGWKHWTPRTSSTSSPNPEYKWLFSRRWGVKSRIVNATAQRWFRFRFFAVHVCDRHISKSTRESLAESWGNLE